MFGILPKIPLLEPLEAAGVLHLFGIGLWPHSLGSVGSILSLVPGSTVGIAGGALGQPAVTSNPLAQAPCGNS